MFSMQSGKPTDKIALYARTSKAGEERDESGPIENQVSYGQEVYIRHHPGQVVGVYRDEGVSGATNPFKRPECGRLMADAKAGKFNVLLVYRLDRLARSLFYLLDVQKQLDEWGVTIRSMTEPLDTSDAMGRFIFNLLGLIAEWERETIKQRTELGRKVALSAGKVMGRPPVGFAVNDTGQLTVHPDEGPLVQEIVTRLARGETAGALERDLTERGIPPLSASRGYRRKSGEPAKWHFTVIAHIAHNDVYWKGEWEYTRRDGTAGFVLPAPKLVDYATALLARKNLASNNHIANARANGTANTYLLSGLIRCQCGSAWVGSGSSNPNRRYYTCRVANDRKRFARDGRTCDMPRVRADKLDEAVWRDLRAMADNPGNLVAKIRAKLAESAGDIEAARLELAAVSREYDALVATRLDAQLRSDGGEMSREELSTYLKAGIARVNELERKRSELADRLALREVDGARVASLEWVSENLKEMMNRAEGVPKLMQELTHPLVRQVRVTRGEDGKPVVHIDYLFPEERLNGGDTAEGGSTSTVSTGRSGGESLPTGSQHPSCRPSCARPSSPGGLF